MSKHIDLSDRNQILLGIQSQRPFSVIAEEIGASPSTVSREVRKHRLENATPSYGRVANFCIHRYSCDKRSICSDKSHCKRKCSTCDQCMSSCPDFVEECCPRLSVPPYVCDGCDSRRTCTLRKYFYDPQKAQSEYRTVLVEARSGFNLSEAAFSFIDDLVSPLVRNGQSLHAISISNKDSLIVSERTLNRLVDMRMLFVRNSDLPGKCALKPRGGKSRNGSLCCSQIRGV